MTLIWDWNDPFSMEEVNVLLEIARRALADGDLFDEMADELDLADDEMKRIQEKLNEYMRGENYVQIAARS